MSDERKIRGKNFDVFISYRRSDGTDKARILDLAFGIDDCRTFLDFKSLGTGAFDKRLENAVLDAPIFIMVLTPDYFARCNQDGDWVRKEIELALENGKKIIPINYDGVLDKVPDYLDEEFRNRIGCHNFLDLYHGTSFNDTVKGIFEREIKPFIGITAKPENKVKVRVKADADCELISDDEVIATIQQGKTAQLFFEKGEYEIIARSIEFSDIKNVIEKTFDNVSFNYLLKTDLAEMIEQRQTILRAKEYEKRQAEEARLALEKAEQKRKEREKRQAEERLEREKEAKERAEKARLVAKKAEEDARKCKNRKIKQRIEWIEKYGGWIAIPISILLSLVGFMYDFSPLFTFDGWLIFALSAGMYWMCLCTLGFFLIETIESRISDTKGNESWFDTYGFLIFYLIAVIVSLGLCIFYFDIKVRYGWGWVFAITLFASLSGEVLLWLAISYVKDALKKNKR